MDGGESTSRDSARPIFIADTCIGGLSVLKSLWDNGRSADAIFMSDYEVNPLGQKSDSSIAMVVERWLALAREESDTLVVACNTLSIRYHQLLGADQRQSGPGQVVSMVNCFRAMAEREADRLTDRKVLIVGTEFTASQALYPELLSSAVTGVRVDTVAATELERRIARFEAWSSNDDSVFTSELRRALDETDVAILACTCFPMAKTELQSLFPHVVFLDPGAYCSALFHESERTEERGLAIRVTGNVVPSARVTEFAKSYIGDDAAVFS